MACRIKLIEAIKKYWNVMYIGCSGACNSMMPGCLFITSLCIVGKWYHSVTSQNDCQVSSIVVTRLCGESSSVGSAPVCQSLGLGFDPASGCVK